MGIKDERDRLKSLRVLLISHGAYNNLGLTSFVILVPRGESQLTCFITNSCTEKRSEETAVYSLCFTDI